MAATEKEMPKMDGWTFEMPVDPSTIGTAQQKRFDPRTRRFFTDKKVAAGMKVISLFAKSAAQKRGAVIPKHGKPVALSISFFFAIPKTRLESRSGEPIPTEGDPCTARWAGDCDNRAKSVVDALTLAGFWYDDQFVTRLEVEKRWTLKAPRIVATVKEDCAT